MQVILESRLEGKFTGWDGDNIYEFVNGQNWQQVHYKYQYKYMYRPVAKILQDGSKYFLEVDGMDGAIEVRRAPSTLYIYDQRGSAVGFWRSGYIYALSGKPIGQLNGKHVHKLSGSYVGELHKDMVVGKNVGNPGNIGNPGNPGNPGSPGNPGNRGRVNYGYPDVFPKLLED